MEVRLQFYECREVGFELFTLYKGDVTNEVSLNSASHQLHYIKTYSKWQFPLPQIGDTKATI